MSRFNLTAEQWENLCDRCGKCCLITLEDEETGYIYHTNIRCRHYDVDKKLCRIYEKRQNIVPNCLKLTEDNVDKLVFMPKSCAYRHLFETQKQKYPIRDLAECTVSEDDVTIDELENYIVDWDDL